MPVYLSQSLIDSLMDQTDLFLHKAIAEWKMLPPTQFAYKASPEKWSANQCIAHLNSYGRYYLPQIEKAMAAGRGVSQQPSLQFKAGWLGNYFTEMMVVKSDGSVAKKMSSPKDHYPTIHNDSSQVIAEFIDQQEKLLRLLDQAKYINLNTIKVPISLSKFIKLKLGDTFLFLIAHNFRHIVQADRALMHTRLEQQKIKIFSLKKMGMIS